MRDKSNPSSSKPKKTRRKFIKVNCLHEGIFKKVGKNTLGMPSAMKVDNLEKRKALNKWYIFHEDFGHVIEDYISLKV